ncbi:hypothetical protein [Enterococcus sp. AZ101]|uniref:hypothetical protein n=1 Tax=Enterococcus sp. AZ101 TaxID=2774742 RepID=UPI003D2993C6
MKKQEVNLERSNKSFPKDTHMGLEKELDNKNRNTLDLENQKGLTEILNSSKRVEQEDENMKTTTIYLVTTTTNIIKDNVEGAYLSYTAAEDNQYTLSLGMIPSEINSVEIPLEMAEMLFKSTYIDVAPLIGDYLNKETKYSYNWNL